MKPRYRICPYNTGWNVQEYTKGWFGKWRWKYVREHGYLETYIPFFKTEKEAKAYIKKQLDIYKKTERNKLKGCYEWSPK